MLSAITTYIPRWLMAIIATALVLATVVGSSQDSAEAIDPADTDTVYIADGTNFADALMGATIASLNTSPMLGVAGTNGGDTIPGDTVAELDRLTNDKANLLDTIYIFGGSQAVSDSVANQLGDWTNDAQRIQGNNRWGTYQAISEMLPAAVDEAVHAQEADHATTADSATEADNADQLDGMDSTDLLGVDDTAADSERLAGATAWNYTDGRFVTRNDPMQMPWGEPIRVLAMETPPGHYEVHWQAHFLIQDRDPTDVANGSLLCYVSTAGDLHISGSGTEVGSMDDFVTASDEPGAVTLGVSGGPLSPVLHQQGWFAVECINTLEDNAGQPIDFAWMGGTFSTNKLEQQPWIDPRPDG